MTSAEFQAIAPSIPNQPGIYKYYDSAGELLYVGKAKNLRKRTSSYFTKTFTGYKTHELVNRIHHVEFTIVNSEQDAFLLENSLIKEFQPRFNINLKDDKSYPYIIKKKKFKVCLEYHLGNCKGPCEALQSAEDYKEGLMQIRQMLKGNLSPVIA